MYHVGLSVGVDFSDVKNADGEDALRGRSSTHACRAAVYSSLKY